MFKFFKKRMSDEKKEITPETATPEAGSPALSGLPTEVEQPPKPREHVTIRPEDVGAMPAGILGDPNPPQPTPPSTVTHTSAPDETLALTGRTLTMEEFVSKFSPVNAAGESVPTLKWEDFNTPGVMIGLIGAGKTTALAAAHQQKCWTVTKRDEGKLAIEAGMNSAEPNKIGYLATQKPWTALDLVVVQ